MKPLRLTTLILIFSLLAALVSCNAKEEPATSATPTPLALESGNPDVVISSLEIGWPEPVPPDPCYVESPAPEINLCLVNQGGGAGSPEVAYLAVPAALVPGGAEALLGTIPGGTWSAPYGLSLTNFPGSDLGAEGIVIVNNNPAPDATAAGIIIVDSLEGQEAIIVIDSIPQPGTLQGIIVIDSHPGEDSSNVGLVTVNLADGEIPSGEISGVEWMEPLEDPQQMAEGVVWGGLVLGADSEFIGSTPHAMPVYSPASDDESESPANESLGAIIWGGMPEGADGIIVVDSLPGSEEGAHGIVIVNNKDISQVMGIIMEDMPADDSGQAGIVIVNNKPAEFHEPGLSWNAAIWPGQAQGDTGSEGIIVIDSMPVGVASLSASMNFGFPEGFSLPEGMTAMMGDSPFGLLPILFGTLDLHQQTFPVALEPGAEVCMKLSLGGGLPVPQAPESISPGDSYFDVTTELTIAIPGSSEGVDLIRQVVQPPSLTYARCTPIPGPTATATTEPTKPPKPTSTPTSPLPLPTATATTKPIKPTSTPTRPLPPPTATLKARSTTSRR